MLSALTRAFGQLGDPAIRRVLWIGMAVALALIVVLTWGAAWLLANVEVPGVDWLTGVLQWLGGFAALIVSLFLFPGVVGMVSSLFLDDVAAAVENRHYPGLGPARRQGIETLLELGGIPHPRRAEAQPDRALGQAFHRELAGAVDR